MDLLDTDPLERLAASIRDRTAVVAVIGLGYVGLPLLVGVRQAGFETIGLDDDTTKVAALRAGRSYIVDVPASEITALDHTTFTEDAATLERADVVVLCLPTPLADGAPDLSMVGAAAETVAAHLRPGVLVILESTTWPGTTEEFLRPILETSGLAAGADFALAYSPERIDPGSSGHQLATTPKVVSGLTDRCRDLAVSFYAPIVGSVAVTSSPRDAEMAKLIENTYRQVNIALVNELAVMAKDLGVDIWEALHAAATKPFGYQPFWPGPGVGGHCIAIDPTYLSWRAGQQLGYRVGFIEHANEVNNRMPDYIATRVAEMLNGAGKAVNGSRLLGVGVAFKAGVDDLRGSPAIDVLERLAAKGADVRFHDPYVDTITIGGRELRSVPAAAATFADTDAVLILTAHAQIDVHAIVAGAPLVFDARGATVGIDEPHVERL
ncbi:MAG TPA: nucleotide sugar dehydrogenase [Actinomycetota bacterium]|jgi:nucleotide sugar dehydrogenase|nr:nucleotide sugar dehydrogenase [Actinomycetota bacterium]